MSLIRKGFASLKRFGLPMVVAGFIVMLVISAGTTATPKPNGNIGIDPSDLKAAVNIVDSFFEQQWQETGINPADLAQDLEVLRRMSLVLHGTIPSLEEIREFERDEQPDRIFRWAQRMLSDPRFADYMAIRFARALVGAEDGQFILFRRDRFTRWLSESISGNVPYDQLCRNMIAGVGLWTGVPETNYITQAVSEGNIDFNKLAGRTVRVFLGQRIDCAQCHDHPFSHWKQKEFSGLAACFAQTKIDVTGVADWGREPFIVEDRKTLEKNRVEPAVPFSPEWQPEKGRERERLAQWITHPDNRRMPRAFANRAWGLVFGTPYYAPVDDLKDPPTGSTDNPRDLLDLLADDFQSHHYDIKRMFLLLLTSKPFRLSSQHTAFDTGEKIDLAEQTWAAFPLTRLRPEQFIGGMLQANSLSTIDQNSHLLTRMRRIFFEIDFVRDYGDLGDNELQERAGTIPQALLRMNGKFARDLSKASPLSASGRTATLAPTSEACLDTCFLACLTRRPTQEEKDYFLPLLNDTKTRSRARTVEDIFWTLYNSPEFAWNH